MYRRVADFWLLVDREAMSSVAVEVVAVLQVNHARGVVLQDGIWLYSNTSALWEKNTMQVMLSKTQAGPG